MRVSQVWLVLQREFLYNLGRRSYLLTAFGVPLMMAIAFGVTLNFTNDDGEITEFDRVGVVDNAELVQPEALEAATLSNSLRADFERFVLVEDAASARQTYDAGELDAYVVIPTDYLQTGGLSFYDDRGIPENLESVLRSYLAANIALQLDSDVPLERLRDPVNLELQLVGEDTPIQETDAILRFLVPFFFSFLLIFNVTVSAQFLMMGVSEEKETRIMEILVTSIRPIELISGKVFGLVLLSILQIAVLILAILGVVSGLGELSRLQEANLDPSLFAVGFVYFILFFFVFAAIMVGIGAATTAEQEARQIAGIFTALAIVPPLYGFPLYLDNPDGIFATVLGLFPFTSPMTNMILMGLGELPTWRLLLSIVILAVTLVFTLWASAKIFRLGMLMYGQRLSLKQITAALRGG